ncbi:MAG: LPS assembly lipoprotein LptE [Gemmatimonadota bacterium]
MLRLVSLLIGLLPAIAGCVYSFAGGGLPGHVRTVAVVPFENTTPQPLIESEVEARMQDVLPRNLGVRLAAEDVADAVVRGRITGYDEVATSVRPTDNRDASVTVPMRQVRITYEAEIYDLREDRSLWRGQGQSVTGNFEPNTESAEIGRTRAIEDLVRRVIDGAQSQW